MTDKINNVIYINKYVKCVDPECEEIISLETSFKHDIVPLCKTHREECEQEYQNNQDEIAAFLESYRTKPK